jgi:hypothetical protein
MDASNMSNAEYFSLNGTLSCDRIESLLAIEESKLGFDPDDVRVKIKEARGCAFKEGDLSDELQALRELLLNVRGANRDTLGAIVENMSNVVARLLQDAEYLISELDDALKIINKADE